MSNVEFTKAADDRMDAGLAKYEFYEYCTDRPGVKSSEVLAQVLGNPATAQYWVNAKFMAQVIHKAWLAA